jgi:hypothetical protein
VYLHIGFCLGCLHEMCYNFVFIVFKCRVIAYNVLGSRVLCGAFVDRWVMLLLFHGHPSTKYIEVLLCKHCLEFTAV